MSLCDRPRAGEAPPYFERYLALVPDGDVLNHLARQGKSTRRLAAGLAEAALDRSYAPNKWSVRAVLAHVVDTERVMAYRVLWAARTDGQALPGFDQDLWAASSAGTLPRGPLLAAELGAVRAATLSLAATLAPAAWTRRVEIAGKSLSARALLYVIAGHELHHRSVLAERYDLRDPDLAP